LLKLTWDRLPICTICRYLAFESFLKHGRSNANLASTIAFDCCLTMLAIFTLVLPAITKITAPKLSAIKKMLGRAKSASQADQNQEDGGSYTQRTDPYGGWETRSVSASTTKASLYKVQTFGSQVGMLGAGCEV
jgi:hypothetical protein